MSAEKGSGADLVQRIERRAPELFDLMMAETDAEFDKAFDVLLEKAVSSLERNCKNFQRLDEEGLSAALAMALSVPGALSVVPEGYSNGHVDLMIEALRGSSERRMLAEAKIYDGPEKHIRGLEQLLTRYTTGREGRGLLIEYFRKVGIADYIEKIRSRMDADRPLSQVGNTVSHTIKWSFLSIHAHNCGENLRVAHIGCNLCASTAELTLAESV